MKKSTKTTISATREASFIKELVIEMPEEMDYKAGGYIQIEIPECEVDYKDIDII